MFGGAQSRLLEGHSYSDLCVFVDKVQKYFRVFNDDDEDDPDDECNAFHFGSEVGEQKANSDNDGDDDEESSSRPGTTESKSEVGQTPIHYRIAIYESALFRTSLWCRRSCSR